VAKISTQIAVMPIAHFASVLKLNTGKIRRRVACRYCKWNLLWAVETSFFDGNFSHLKSYFEPVKLNFASVKLDFAGRKIDLPYERIAEKVASSINHLFLF